MNKIVPFNKDIVFKTDIFEICSISLEKEVKIDKNSINGEFILEGEYKVSNEEAKEKYNFRIPFDIKLDEKYDISNVKDEISDFYYEVKDNNILKVYIEVKLDNIEEIERCIEEEDNSSGYLTYKIYIVKENDTIESIMNKYNVTKEELESYNDLSNLKLGDKIIIPKNAKNS